jgi:hypothetical protein
MKKTAPNPKNINLSVNMSKFLVIKKASTKKYIAQITVSVKTKPPSWATDSPNK